MVHIIACVLLVGLFAGTGLFNLVGSARTREDFVRWGYPRFWCHVTGAIECLAALLIAVPMWRVAGLVLGALVIAAAAATILRHRAFGHAAPVGLFAVLLLIGAATV